MFLGLGVFICFWVREFLYVFGVGSFLYVFGGPEFCDILALISPLSHGSIPTSPAKINRIAWANGSRWKYAGGPAASTLPPAYFLEKYAGGDCPFPTPALDRVACAYFCRQ